MAERDVAFNGRQMAPQYHAENCSAYSWSMRTTVPIILQDFRIVVGCPPSIVKFSRGDIENDPAVLAAIRATGRAIGATARGVLAGKFAVGDILTTTVGGTSVAVTLTAPDLIHQTGLAGSDLSISDIAGKIVAALLANPTISALATPKLDVAYGGVFLKTTGTGAAMNNITFAVSATSASGTYTTQQATFQGAANCSLLSSLPAEELGLSEQLSNTLRGGMGSGT